MMSISGSNLVALFGVMLLLSVVPGPSDIAVVSRSLSSGFGRAVYMVLGIVAADLVFIVVAVFGLTALYQLLGDFFVIVQYACGAYLIWLGVSQLRAKVQPNGGQQFGGQRWSNFGTGLLITLADPKAILFYMGLFPAFVDISSISVFDALAIMALATSVIVGVKLGYAYVADRATSFFKNAAARTWLNRIAGCGLVCVGLLVLVGR